MPYITIETYPDMTNNNGEENHNYDNEMKVFTIPYDWLSELYRENDFGPYDLDWFLTHEYDWDDTYFIYEQAYIDKVIIDERIVRR